MSPQTEDKLTAGYALIDSGDGIKIEQVEGVILARPSTWCIWKLKGDSTPAVIYDPKREGWGQELSPWPVSFPDLGVVVEARLQRNGQIGIFPEHASYLPQIALELQRKPGAKVLNLFAFTGLASMVALKNGASVTHVDILKPVLDWAARNADLNGLNRGQLRLIPDEALAFLAREVRRANLYDVIILDPPSFSRIAKGKDWELDNILRELLSLSLQSLSANGSLYFTCHHGELAGSIIENLIRELENDKSLYNNNSNLSSQVLTLTESDGTNSRLRRIPAGFLTTLHRAG